MTAHHSRAVGTLALLAVSCAVTVLHADGPPAKPTQKVDFNREIRPILTETCFACHGPDPKKRKADLRLDQRDAAIKHGALVPGKSVGTEMFDRLVSTEPGKLMPPAKSGKKLTPSQIELIRRWLNEGGHYADHWAFVPPKRAPLPAVKNAAWSRNPIDRFILARLEAEGLAPEPEADRVTLLRRVTLDLTGLPPTLAEVDAFLADQSPTAYEKVVDRLLKSPRYGEHMGRYWLDLARFGDTHGLHLDNYREMWPYRDWVIRAFNANKSYDRFLLEQLAGDLLPGAKTDDLVATGFNRAHVTTSEGGVISEEVHIQNVNDRVETLGTVVFGMTVVCSKCHDHKFDPLTMKDFYSLSAFFNSLEGNPLDGNAARHPPTISVPGPEQEAQLAAVDKKLQAARKDLAARAASFVYDDTQDAGEAEQAKRADHVWIDDQIPGGKVTVGGFNRALVFVTAPEPVHSGKRALKLTANGLAQFVLEGASPELEVGAGDKLFAHVYLDPNNPPQEIMLQWFTNNWLHRAYWGANKIDWGRDNSSERRSRGALPEAGKWVRLEVPIGQVGIKPGTRIQGWAFTQFGGTAYWDQAGINTQIPQGGGVFDTLASWVRAQRARKGAGLPADIQAIVQSDRAKRTPAQQKQLRDYFVQNAWRKSQTELAPLHQVVTALEAERAKIDQAIPVTYIFRETPTPRTAYILKRGEYDKRGDAVTREVPALMGTFPEGAPRNRLGLAQWVLAPANPLTARVAVNRYWQQVFGTGIVKTAEDFGLQGEPPTHPELLDWLAVEFRETNWDVKRLMKLLVTSAAYRQGSKLTPEKLARDQANRLLSRGTRYRLDAEAIRDQALFVSGLLVEKMGGPSVKPPQPPGLWEAVGYTSSNTARFTPDTGREKVHRRSLYTFWKRTSAPAAMTTMDAPSRESCTVRRERTNTPLQALLLLNDVQYIEAARALSERGLREGGKTDAERIGYLFRLVTGRRPHEKELAELTAALGDLRKEFARNPQGAQRLIRIGESKPDASLSAADLAAWTMLSNTLLNLDEVLNKG
ncbi:MAG: PSD1 and planctomycete cytochrome C domain-containing protein [Gemmataceae bacterium]